jgi:hypothetical protein
MGNGVLQCYIGSRPYRFPPPPQVALPSLAPNPNNSGKGKDKGKGKEKGKNNGSGDSGNNSRGAPMWPSFYNP